MPLFTSFYLGRPGPLWPTRSTLADQVHFGRSGQLWPTSSASADQVHFDRPGPLWPIRSTVADQVHFGRSSPLWPIKSTWLRSTWPSDFVINSGDARLSHRINFTSVLLQHPDPLDIVHGHAQANSSIYMYMYIEILTNPPFKGDPTARHALHL